MDEKHNTKSLNADFQPLQRIALSLSGGGYRAASFHLGILSYLYSKNYRSNSLLQNVKGVSTVSGGSITGAFYVIESQQGKGFIEIYHDLISWMRNTDLIKLGLQKISTKGEWKYSYKKRNLINAFAEIYDETLFKSTTFKDFLDLERIHLDFISINATDFTTGNQFRFQHMENVARVYFGNGELEIGKEYYPSIRISDAVAASSAFPGGFEPIAMPDDFLDPDSESFSTIKEKLKEYNGSMGLMDGGIYDNQGATSLQRYEDRKSTSNFDLYFFCDVSSPYLAPFNFSDEKNGSLRDSTIEIELEKLKKINNKITWGIVLFFLFALLILFIGGFQNNITTGIGIALSLVAVIFYLLRVFLLRKLSNVIKDINNYLQELIPVYFLKRIKLFDYQKTTIGKLEVLLLNRLKSLQLLFPDIFLKRIRSLHYDNIYENKELNFRRASCLIKELTRQDFSKTLGNFNFMGKYYPELRGNSYKEIIGDKIESYVKMAAEFGTTLWFTDDDFKSEKLKALVISGQVGCCQDLLYYLSELINGENSPFSNLEPEVQNDLNLLHTKIMKDWFAFKENPEWLYNQLEQDTHA